MMMVDDDDDLDTVWLNSQHGIPDDLIRVDTVIVVAGGCDALNTVFLHLFLVVTNVSYV